MSDTYHVTAQRWSGGWELHIEGVGVTQARRLSEADEMARDYIHLSEGIASDSFSLELNIKVDDSTDAKVKAARAAVRDGAAAQQAAASQSRQVVQKLKSKGLLGADIAAILGISTQRVSQLARPTRVSSLPGKPRLRLASKTARSGEGRKAKPL